MNATIAKLAAQALLGRRRFWLLLAFPVLLIALTATIAALTDGDAAWPLLPGLGYPVVLPLVAVLAASSVLGPEVDDGSIVYLLCQAGQPARGRLEQVGRRLDRDDARRRPAVVRVGARRRRR